MEQFLTAVFELSPSIRKAAALERVRGAAEVVFWRTLAQVQSDAEATVTLPLKERREAISRLAKPALDAAGKAGLCEPVAQGLARDLQSTVCAYVEARAKGREASWPVQVQPEALPPLADRLDAFLPAITLEAENVARDALNRRPRLPRARPIILARERDCRILRDEAGRLAVALNVMRASDPRAWETTIKAGFDATTGEALKERRRKTVILVPLACGRWHENKFLSGNARLASAVVYPRGDKWWLQAQFAMRTPAVRPTGKVLGIDRGVVHPAALAIVDTDGAVIEVPGRRGEGISKAVSARREVMRRQQRGGSEKFRRRLGRSAGATRTASEVQARTRIGRRIDCELHCLANEIVGIAKRHGATVVLEKLDSLKQAMGTKRAAGARRGGWGTVLRKAQLAKLEALIGYKLALAGLPKPREAIAAGSSITCPACALADKRNRSAQAVFTCVGCGFSQHADDNAAVIVARRGAFKIQKGDKLDTLHRNMVERLRSRDDGGLGPLAGYRQRVVAARASAGEAHDRTFRPTSPAGRDGSPLAVENPSGYSQSATAAFRRRSNKRKPVAGQGLLL